MIAVLLSRADGLKEKLTELERERALEVSRLEGEIDRERDERALVGARIETWITDKTAAEVRLTEVERHLAQVSADRDQALAQRDTAISRRAEAEEMAALRGQELADLHRQMDDWESTKTRTLEFARAAMLETVTHVSNKLIHDHKLESEQAKRENEERLRTTSEQLLRQLADIAQFVASLKDQVGEARNALDVVWKAMSNPGGAGQAAEIGLENMLKSFGLERGRDFVIQQPIEGSRLRPDVLVFLPSDTVLIVDAKASKHFLELANTEGTDDEVDAYARLKQTMLQHLKSLVDRNYREAVRDSYREAGRENEIRRILSVMYLPHDGAIEKLRRADAEFIQRAINLDMIVAGPSSLACLLAFARVDIDLGRRIENQDKIVSTTEALLDGILDVLENTAALGRGLKAAGDGYARLTGSINQRLLPRMRGLISCGVKPSKHKKTPSALPEYRMIQPGGSEPDDDVESNNTIGGDIDSRSHRAPSLVDGQSEYDAFIRDHGAL